MRLSDPLAGSTDAASTYDEIYTQSWKDTLNQCRKSLEDYDHERALQVKTLQDFRDQLEILLEKHNNHQAKNLILLLYPTLAHYEKFAQNFVKMMANPVDTSMMWGLLFLVLNVAIETAESGRESPLARISRWLKKIGHELRTSNECNETITETEKVVGDTIEVNKEMIILWLNVIMTFRNQAQGREVILAESAWETLTGIYNAAYRNIEEAVRRIERVAEMTDKQALVMQQRTMIQRIMSLEHSKQEGVTLPCNTLPVAENTYFFGRVDILKKIDDHLTPTDIKTRQSSVALFGLGGIGKTQTALAYAYQKLDELDAVLWIAAEDSLAVQKSFSNAAVNGLKLPRAHPQAHQENMILVLDWLQKTSAKWLLIFDNVDESSVLDNCWPASRHGAILVTTRDVLVATLPIDRGMEISEFDPREGADFLLKMSHKRRKADREDDAAQHVSKELGGLPLALNQMAALINARNCSIMEFAALYAKHAQRLHKQKKSGWKYLGYEHALDTIWELAFTSLSTQAQACLGVLSFLSADSVPAEIFTSAESAALPDLLAFCEDEFSLGEVLEELTHQALLRKNIENGTFRIHRLVQAEYRARMSDPQSVFEATTELLLEKFPSQRSNKYGDDEWALYEKYISQVIALQKNYNESQSQPTPLKPNSNFVNLLVNAANAIHDNDTTNVVPGLLDTADEAYRKCPVNDQDRLLWAFLLSLKSMNHLGTSEFKKSELEMTEGLAIRLGLLPADDLLISLAYSWLGMAIGSQNRFQEGLDNLLLAGKCLEGPAGKIPTRKLVWGYNISRNYYCMGRYEEAEQILTESLKDADNLQSWYMQVYGHFTFASLRTRMDRLDEAKHHIDIAQNILETSGITARFSWLSSSCAYRAGYIAFKQGRFQDAIRESERAVAIGKLVNIPQGILSRCIHSYSVALATDSTRHEEAEVQRLEARKLRSQLPEGGGDLDDESDAAFESLVKMDQR